MKPVYGWHFLREDGKLNYPPHAKVKVGKTLKAKGDLVMCQNGMHFSKRPIDALSYAPGAILCYVKASGEIIHDTDKSVARERTALWIYNAEEILHRVAIWSAKQSFRVQKKLGNKIHPDAIAAVKAKELWLEGKITDDELEAARSAAWSAAMTAAWSAAKSAARFMMLRSAKFSRLPWPRPVTVTEKPEAA